ncbi:MAG: thiamine pyrophosphate-binding protein [Thermodesulfobacteriota bacterium]|nr:thiamine pyrophosphate-binding protein [Thermodesulfobacteriota bacterium]
MKQKYGSDLMVDLLNKLDIDYIAFNPGASFRGLHESIVNYGGNKKPEIIFCCHENVAVSLAQGYAKAALKPMAAVTHNVVGLLNGSFAIYIDWLDQTPILLLGGTGPMAIELRRPGAEFHHTALVQGNVIRDIVKWDDQPYSIDSLAEGFYRGYRAAMSEPKGPVYICLDLGLQEQQINENYRVPDFEQYPVPRSPQADPSALQEVARLLVQAKRPVVMADYLGRNPSAVAMLVELSELLVLPVIDAGSRFNFPNTHPLDLTGAQDELIETADVILGLDMHNFYDTLTKMDRGTRQQKPLFSETAKIIHIGLQELLLRAWIPHLGRLQPMNLSITADTSLALPALIPMCKQEMASNDPVDRKKRFAMLKEKHEDCRKKWQAQAVKTSKDSPVSLPFLASELWEVVKRDDWVLVNRRLEGWTRRLWDWTSPHQWIGAFGGGSVGYGVAHSIGAALAHKGTGRLCIDIQPDGDFLYHPSALWTAAHHHIPLLVVMFNNRSYYNSEDHQESLSRARGRSTSTAGVGTHIDNPPVNFAGLAQNFGVYGEGPIDKPEEVRPALERAVRYVKEHNSCALVDIVTKAR